VGLKEGKVRLNIPLLPILVEVRRRPLPPLRVSIRGLMIAVLLAGLFFALVAKLGRVSQALSYHTDQIIKAYASPSKSPPYGITPLETWHVTKMMEYRAAHERLDLTVLVAFMACASLVLVAALARVIHWLSRPSVIPPRDEPPRRREAGLVKEAR
jgi:hypothetical protein